MNKRKRENGEKDDSEPNLKKQKLDHIQAIAHRERWEKLNLLRSIYMDEVTPEELRIKSHEYAPVPDMRTRKKYMHGPMKKCRALCASLMSNPNAKPFIEPVKINMAPDYYQIIQRPMSFSVIMMKLDQKKYNRVEEFRDDVKQVFKNCYRYNLPGSEYRNMSDRLEKEFEKMFKYIKIESDAIREVAPISITKHLFTKKPSSSSPVAPPVAPPPKKKKKTKAKIVKKTKKKKKKKKRLKKKKAPLKPKSSDDFINDGEIDEEDFIEEMWEEDRAVIAELPQGPVAPLPPRRSGAPTKRRRRRKKKDGGMDDFIVDEEEDMYDYFIEPDPQLARRRRGAPTLGKKKKSRPPAAASSTAAAAAPRRRKKKAVGAVPGSTITDEQKKQLARIIPTLTDEQKGEILKMVQETTEEDDGSVTLDLNFLEGKTLKKMFEFCKNCAKENAELGSSSSDDSSDDSSESSSDED